MPESCDVSRVIGSSSYEGVFHQGSRDFDRGGLYYALCSESQMLYYIVYQFDTRNPLDLDGVLASVGLDPVRLCGTCFPPSMSGAVPGS